MITAILTMAVVWCLGYGQIAPAILAPLCVGLGIALSIFSNHRHTRFFTIDVAAQASLLNRVNATLKFVVALLLMLLCVAAAKPWAGLFLAGAMLVLTVAVGGIKLPDYINLLALPAAFLLISGLALLFEFGTQPFGVINIPLFGGWLCVSRAAQGRAALIMARAIGALSCLYFLSLSTPMSELIAVLRAARCPDMVIELMYLMYRYIFILLTMYHSMRDAAKSRLGYLNYRNSLRTTGSLYTNLLARSYRMANINFDAMESRCYSAGIRFLERREKLRAPELAVASALMLITLWLSLL